MIEFSELKAFAYYKLIVYKMTDSLFDGVENTVEKGENAAYQHFLLVEQFFKKNIQFKAI